MELGFWGRALFGSLALELGNLDEGFDMLGFVFDMQGKALDSLAVHQRSWERHSGNGEGLDKLGGSLDIWRENFGEFGADSNTTKYGHLDKWGRHSSCRMI